jgi:DNA-binding transcriptional MocR family regulator
MAGGLRSSVDEVLAVGCQVFRFEVARGGFLDRHVRCIRTVYRERRDAMVAALRKYFPAGVHWTTPQGGLFLW